MDSFGYAIGTAQGGTDVLYWNTTGQKAFARAGLPLVKGKTYWVSVQAHNQAGLWGASGSASFVAGKAAIRNIYLPMVQK